jgi:hypothetical protein
MQQNPCGLASYLRRLWIGTLGAYGQKRRMGVALMSSIRGVVSEALRLTPPGHRCEAGFAGSPSCCG